jgi:RNA polymerase sigma-70 factor (ECF subfamily)
MKRVLRFVRSDRIFRAIDTRYEARRFERLNSSGDNVLEKLMSQEHEGTSPTGLVGVEYLDGLYSYAMVLTRDSAESEDIVQKTYNHAINNLRAVGESKCWFFRILRNIWSNRRKWHNAPQAIEIGVDEALSGSIAVSSKNSQGLDMGKMDVGQVRTAIQELPMTFREVILLREYEEFSHQEIAGILDCPIETVMSHLRRARAKLLTLLYATPEGVNLLSRQSLQGPTTNLPVKLRLRLQAERLIRQRAPVSRRA